jgi:CubicO group peptidase (beta-lactamase class C family)
MTLPPPLDWQIAKIGPGQGAPPEHRVTRENWRLYPYSRWAFQHTRELVPSRALCRSTVPGDLDENIVPLDDLQIAGDSGDSAISWAEFEAQTYTDAMLIIHNGMIIHERYYNGMTRRTPHHAFSVSKSFIGLLAESMIADDVLDKSAAVTTYVPELAESGFAKVEIHHLLDMTDGVAFDEDYANLNADVHRYSANYWTPALADGGVRAALARLNGRDHAPGSEFSYRTPCHRCPWLGDRTGERKAACRPVQRTDMATRRLRG